MALPALVLVHGSSFAADSWDLTVDEIHRQAPELTVLAVDLPGRRGKPGDLFVPPHGTALVDTFPGLLGWYARRESISKARKGKAATMPNAWAMFTFFRLSNSLPHGSAHPQLSLPALLRRVTRRGISAGGRPPA
jgi:hypothetical protein